MPSLNIRRPRPVMTATLSRDGLRRRDALKLLAANMALAAAGCGKPQEEIVPYVEMPERLVPGIPLKFATTLALAGYGRGVLVTSHEGRPTKIEGNPRHPGSLGSTDVFAEADIFNLYDPARSQTVHHGHGISTWESFINAWVRIGDTHRQNKGAGLRLLTGRVTSPTLLRQIKALQALYSNLVWHAYDPVGTGYAAATQAAFKRPLDSFPRLSDADAVLSLDSRFLDAGPQQIPLARQFANKRRVRRGTNRMLRLYAAEAVPSLTGANADHVLVLTPREIEALACTLALKLGAGVPNPNLTGEAAQFVEAVLSDLKARQGGGLVLGGPGLSPDTQALVHWINARLNAPVTYIEPVAGSDSQPGLAELAQSLKEGQVQALIVLEGNPVYDAPADLDFASALQKAKTAIHFGLAANETSALCQWQLPASHALESWSDLRAIDGTASLVQPLIEPLYDTKTAHDLIAILSGSVNPSSYDIVRETWKLQGNADNFEQQWRKSLQDGVIENTASKPVTPGEPNLPDIKLEQPRPGITLLLSPDPSLWDGSYAQNAWLQECPKPLTKQVWGNALGMSAATAKKAGVANGDRVLVAHGGRRAEVPVSLQEGHAPDVLSLTLGHGRWVAGAIGTGIGSNAYALRDSAAPWLIEGCSIERISGTERAALATAVTHLDAATEDLYPLLTLASFGSANLKRNQQRHPSLLPDSRLTEPSWAMVIDNSACIGCNACVVACQSENSVPVVGPEEIEEGRVMHWLRIDAYEGKRTPAGQRGITGFQPVPCMHCEKAPCEPVCPVEASVHDSEGLNLQVYNRCVGTRFCQANCPYKVRRFNFFGYANGQEYKDLGAEVLWAQKNPDVTVRARGVMEKCTYCIQRISRARQNADRENREIQEGEVRTACQTACPTQAISFGDLKRNNSEVSNLRTEPQHYALLGNLNTRPRTTYLARVQNPNPELEKGEG
jgi:Fe-S-cluster-containing dehydrogenase component